MFSNLAALGILPRAAAGGAWPLIILLLVAAWAGFLASSSVCVWRIYRERGGLVWLILAGVFLTSLCAALLFSPGVPVLSTYTGLAHISSAYRIATFEWSSPFPTDYPLTVPVFAALFVTILGKFPESFGVANSFLSALGAAGTVLLSFELFSSLVVGALAGALFGLLPLVLLLASADGLALGYASLSAWTIFLALKVLRTPSGNRTKSMVRWSRFGLVCALVLVCQTRLEALLFPAFVLLLPLAVLESRERLRGERLLATLLAGALAALVPHLLLFVGEFLLGGRLWTEIGTHLVGRFAGGTLAVCAGLLAAARLWKNASRSAWPMLLVGAVLFAGFGAGSVFTFGFSFLDFSPVCIDDACTARTFATIPAWHFNPKMVPLGAVLLFSVGLCSFKDMREARSVAFLMLWFGAILAAASVKSTGELPFEGARTQIPATAPFVILCALGAERIGGVIRRPWAAPTAAAVLTLPFLPGTLSNINPLDYNEQHEFSFFRSCLPNANAKEIFAPNDVVNVLLPGDTYPTLVDLYALYRTGYMVEAMGDAVPRLRVRQLSEATEASVEGGALFMRNLNCYRSGDGSALPACRRAEELFELEPICETVVSDPSYSSDFYEQTRIRGDVSIGIYRIIRLKTGPLPIPEGPMVVNDAHRGREKEHAVP